MLEVSSEALGAACSELCPILCGDVIMNVIPPYTSHEAHGHEGRSGVGEREWTDVVYRKLMSNTIQKTKQNVTQKVPHAECKQPVPRGYSCMPDGRRTSQDAPKATNCG